MPAGICGVAKPPRVCIARRGYLLEAARARRRRSPHSCRCSQRTPMALPNPDPDYRINTGICLYRNGLVWVGRRLKTPTAGPRWQMPQGGIDAGEDPAAAAKRELEEETGVKSARVVAETWGWLHYVFPEDADHTRPESLRSYKGQAQKWFLMKFEGEESEICLDKHEQEFVEYAWWTFEQVLKEVVPFKRRVYESVRDQFEHIVQSDS